MPLTKEDVSGLANIISVKEVERQKGMQTWIVLAGFKVLGYVVSRDFDF